LEGPEAGVYYRGEGKFDGVNGCSCVLPEYVELIATDFTIQLTPIFEQGLGPVNLATTKFSQGKFFVYELNGKPCSFYWTLFGKRLEIDVEPEMSKVQINGSGPYKWIA
jgi:hypothetical protein